jgi:hypothetical protein
MPSGLTISNQSPQEMFGADKFKLPLHDEILSLLKFYFANAGRFHPFIDKDKYTNPYMTMRSENFLHVRRSWLGLLNMMFALAISTSCYPSRSAKSRAELYEIYYERSPALCNVHVVKGFSLETGRFMRLL